MEMSEVPETSQLSTTDGDDSRVAVIGMAGRFPGAPDVDTFWENLTHGREGITTFTDDELRADGVDPDLLGRDDFVRAKGELAGADRFDAAFFGFNPREAEIMDPQHRVFLECAWEALESAGVVPKQFDGRVGVFAGAGFNSYLLRNVTADPQVSRSAGMYQVMLSGDKDFLSTRVAYKLGLTGPAITVQTACSTSLTAVHLAVQSLLAGECDVALAGGVSVSSPLKDGYVHEPGGILSADGHCRPFDAEAGGTVPGNGVGVVVLRRLSDARADGDVVDAVIRGSAINNDGSLKAGYTAPSTDGQAEVITEALAVAGVDADDIGYVETHGTGTKLGDPIELAALTRVFGERSEAAGPCAIGSVKSNIGHLDAAAGVTSLIKTALILKHGTVPPTLHFSRPNPELSLESSPFHVPAELLPWPEQQHPRLAGVSSFGIGGTNVHVVLEQAPPACGTAAPEVANAGRPVVLPLSARAPEALTEGARRLADHLEGHPNDSLTEVARTLVHRRQLFEHRGVAVGRDHAEAVAALRALRPAGPPAGAGERAPVAFLFPGQGTQYVGMARDLYHHEPVFAQEFDRCADLFVPHLDEDLRALIITAPSDDPEAARRLEQTAITQPALFTVEYALARLWMSWGVRPRAMAGHSIGEYVAACLAGVFSLEDAARLVAARGRLVQGMEPGAMLTVFLSEDATRALLADGLGIAAVNSTELTVVSGPAAAVGSLEQTLKAKGISCRRLHTSHAFHSASMDGAVAPLVEEVRSVRLNAPSVPLLSDVTGTWITGEQATDPEYWGRHLRAPVRFADILSELLADPAMVLIEAGPGNTLGNFARGHREWHADRVVVASLRHPSDRQDDRVHLLRGVGTAWSAGAGIDWDAVQGTGTEARTADGGPAARQAVRLPGQAFQRQSYWVRPGPGADRRGPDTGRAPGRGATVDDWFRTPVWRRLALPPNAPTAADPGALWVLLGAETGVGSALAGLLEQRGAPVVRVRSGAEFAAEGEDSFVLDPARREDCAALFKALDARAPETLRLVHLFSLALEDSSGTSGTSNASDTSDASGSPALDTDRLRAGRQVGFDSLLALAQGLDEVHPSAPVTVDVLCHGVRDVTGDEELRPELATLTGVTTVMPQELSGVTVRTLDITGVDRTTPRDTEIRAVHRMLSRPGPDRDLALRGRHWWTRDFDAVALDGPGGEDGGTDSGTPRLRDGGGYLITGGLGGIGLALAEHIARRAEAPVLGLLGRSPLPAEPEWDDWLASHGPDDPTGIRIRRLRGLRELGARILPLTADVTDPEQTAQAVRTLREAAGGLHGVVHAAGVPSNGMMSRKTAEDADRVLAAKTLGTLVLDQVCGDEPDFVLLCSSITGVLGGPGQSDYCAANAFLDAFAEWRNRRGDSPAVTSVAWDTWNDVGMAAGMAAHLGGATDNGTPTGHPQLRLLETTERSSHYTATYSTADTWVVNDHRLMGHGLVPGTAFVDLVHAAVAERAGERVTEVRDLLFMHPVIVPDGQSRTIHLFVEETGTPGDTPADTPADTATDAGTDTSTDTGTDTYTAPELRFTVRSRLGGVWRDHAVGQVSFAERVPTDVRDLEELRVRCEATEVLDTPEALRDRMRLDVYEKGHGPLKFQFGPRWRMMRTLHVGSRRLLATLRLDDAFLDDVLEYTLHPALLDMAGGAFRIHATDLYYLPLTYRAIQVYDRLPGTVICSVETKDPGDGETLSCDIEMLDADGRLLVAVTDFTVKRIKDMDGLLEQVAQDAHEPADDGDQAPRARSTLLDSLSEGIGEEEGVQVFARLLDAPALPGHLLVSAQDFTARRELFASLTPELMAEELGLLGAPAGAHPRPALDTPYVAPATDDERAVALIWQEILGLEEVGVQDDFFALGGHSLAAVQIGTRFRSRFGVELELREFFTSPTITHTVELLEVARGRENTPRDTIRRLDRTATDESGPDASDETDGSAGLDDLTDEELDGLTDEEVEARLSALLAEERQDQDEQEGN